MNHFLFELLEQWQKFGICVLIYNNVDALKLKILIPYLI